MSDEELTQAIAELQEVVRCRCDEAYRDRGLKDPHCECDSAEAVKVVADRIEALTKERDDAREYAGEVRKREMAAEDARISATDKLATCEKYRDAYAEMDRIGTQAVRDLEAKLAKAVEIGDKMAKSIEGNYYIPGVVKEWRATISDLKQEVSKT